MREQLPLPTEGIGSWEWWQEAITQAEKPRNDLNEAHWQKNVAAYQGLTKKDADDIPVNVDFYNVEQKKAQLFFKTPAIQLTPKRPVSPDAITIFQEVINHFLGPHGVNAAAAVDECLFDLLCPAGVMAVKIGYEAIQDGTIPMQMVDPLSGMPMTIPAPNIVSERYFTDRISPAKLLKPKDFFGSDHDKAPWLGFEFVEEMITAKGKWKLPADFDGGSADTHRLVKDPANEQADGKVIGKEIWYRASLIDPKVKHPDKIRQLIFIDGHDQPVVHRDSPYQRFDERGKFVGGMRGFPVHVGSLRVVGDAAWVPSDCTISRPQVDELSGGRKQGVQQRKRSLPMRWVDRNRISPEDLDRIVRGRWQEIIPVDGNGNEIIGEVARAQFPRETAVHQQMVEMDIAKMWALGANQQGALEDSVRSATELSLIQQNVNTRLAYEQNKVTRWFIGMAEKLGSLIQLFADTEDYIAVAGKEGDQRLQAWDRTTIQGEFAYAIKPDSGQHLDAAADRKQYLDYVNFHAKNPNVNLVELTRIGAEKFNLDPQRILKPPTPPGPPPPNVSVRVTMDDLAGPAATAALKILQQAGYQLTEEDVVTAQMGAMVQQAEQAVETEHGGPADKQGPLSQKTADLTGQMSGPSVMGDR